MNCSNYKISYAKRLYFDTIILSKPTTIVSEIYRDAIHKKLIQIVNDVSSLEKQTFFTSNEIDLRE